jgi:hypothetical protein
MAQVIRRGDYARKHSDPVGPERRAGPAPSQAERQDHREGVFRGDEKNRKNAVCCGPASRL